MSTQRVDLSHVLPYETTYFDDRLAVDRNDLDIPALLGVDGDVSDELLVSLCGAPAGAEIQAYLDSADRFTLAVTHSTLIESENRVSVLQTSDTSVLELGTIDLVDNAVAGLGAVMLWRIVRACAKLGIAWIIAFAVGGAKPRRNPVARGFTGTTHGHGSASMRRFRIGTVMRPHCFSISAAIRPGWRTVRFDRCARSTARDSGATSGESPGLIAG